jgi:hypothetical protein
MYKATQSANERSVIAIETFRFSAEEFVLGERRKERMDRRSGPESRV